MRLQSRGPAIFDHLPAAAERKQIRWYIGGYHRADADKAPSLIRAEPPFGQMKPRKTHSPDRPDGV
jgi:hypothetical protein